MLEERGVTSITQYTTKIMPDLSRAQRNHLSVAQKLWTVGDRLYKLSAQYYGSPKYWWVIARFNNKPTDAHFNVGETVYIPMPREVIFDMYGV
jgi:hypothetical protein